MSIEISKGVNNDMELNERISKILEENKIKPGINVSEFARSIGTYPTKIAEMKSGKVKSISGELAIEISKKYGINYEWIVSGKGSMQAETAYPSELIDSMPELKEISNLINRNPGMILDILKTVMQQPDLMSYAAKAINGDKESFDKFNYVIKGVHKFE